MKYVHNVATHTQVEPGDSHPNMEDPLVRLKVRMEQTLEAQIGLSPTPDIEVDGDAILRLPPERHPIDRFLMESAQSITNQRNLRNRLRACYRLLTGNDGDVSLEALRAFAWHLISVQDIDNFEQTLEISGYKPATRNAHRAALRSIVHNCRRAGLMNLARSEMLLDRLALEKFEREPVGRVISPEELDLIMAALRLPDPWRMWRDRAMVAVMATTGIRVSELCSVTIAGLNQPPGWLAIPMTKNGSPHRVPMASGTTEYLNEWLACRSKAPGYLFIPRPKKYSSPLCVQAVQFALDRATASAGLEKCTPHDFRRTLATTLLRSHDPSTVMRLLNHKSLNSTLVYDRSDELLQAAAIDALPLPQLTDIAEGETR